MIDAVAEKIENGMTRGKIEALLYYKVMTRSKNIKRILERCKSRCFDSSHTYHNLCNLTFPQLIVLYGRLWEKELKEEQLKEIDKYEKC